MNKITTDHNRDNLLLLMQEIRTHIDAAMREDITASLEGSEPDLCELIEYALFGGGKRVRPVLVTTCSPPVRQG